MAYPFTNIEAKWQAYWRAHGTFRTPEKIDTTRPKATPLPTRSIA